MVVLNLCKKLQEKWSHLTTQEKKLTDAKLVTMCCIYVYVYASLYDFQLADYMLFGS